MDTFDKRPGKTRLGAVGMAVAGEAKRRYSSARARAWVVYDWVEICRSYPWFPAKDTLERRLSGCLSVNLSANPN